MSTTSRSLTSLHTMQTTESQIVLILVGLIGSGKSTFAQALEQQLPHFRRCNQDDLAGDRRRVEVLARESLRAGLSVCIDRTNFDPRQRATWINMAYEFPGTQVWILVFDTPYEVCAQRLQERINHPTIKTPEHGRSVLERFHSQYQAPSPYEGYSRLLSLRPSDHPSPVYTYDDISGILQRIQDAPSPASTPATGPKGRGHHTRGYRGHQTRGHGDYRGCRGSGSRFGRSSHNPLYGSDRPGFERHGTSSGSRENFNNSRSDSDSWRS
ncbi:uncharacterized protein FIBRA_03258 [Fibroporia radiculosa]|uniref:P-loop containing nucleoside triphosphate hydrolase protein n=1 Tax=Fibroporia radiculosa TaxID=599839 RepID=J4GND7_9APHY|nr:uncharacterized protein FIBRA_03258 [Fibroporia radiculosa]CCM01210.1 predicted protein [Fibroporia radiculosa]